MAKGRGAWVAPASNRPKGEARAPKEKRLIASNKKARHDYAVEDVFEAGIMLTGTEVKALRQGRASLVDGFAEVDGREAWLLNVHIPEYFEGTWNNHSTRRKRKLLLHAAEIAKLGQAAAQPGYTLVPLSLYFLGSRAKVEVAVARGKREYDKRQALRERQDAREAERAMSHRADRGE